LTNNQISGRTRRILFACLSQSPLDDYLSDDPEEPYRSSGSEYLPGNSETDSDNEPLFIKKARNQTQANKEAPGHDVLQLGITEMVPNNESPLEDENKQKKSRKRKSLPKTWKRYENKENKNKGKAYIRKMYKGIDIEAKNPCILKRLCKEKCRLKCDSRFSNEEKVRLFEEHYSLDQNAKSAYLFGIMEAYNLKQPSGLHRHHRKSFRYSFKVGGDSRRVCKEAVMPILDVGRKKLDLIRDQVSSGRSAPKRDGRGHHNSRPRRTSEEKRNFVHRHIRSFPSETKMRTDSTFLHGYPSTKFMLCMSKSMQTKISSQYLPLHIDKFLSMILILDLVLQRLIHVQLYDVGSNEEHVAKYKKAFGVQKSDRENARANEQIIYLTFDLQKTLPLPKISTSKAFYLRQVWLYNLGIHLISTQPQNGKGFFHVWTEVQGSRGPEEIGSSLMAFLENIKDQSIAPDHLIAWSDSAGGQNRNFYIVCLWHYLIFSGVFRKIDHKFPEVGHTFMDSDRDFAAVEKSIRKHQSIYTNRPIYLCHGRSQEKKTPFSITRMVDKFVDIKELPRKLGFVDRKKKLQLTRNFHSEMSGDGSVILYLVMESLGSEEMPMPSSTNRYKKRKKWSEEDMAAAVQAVREKKMGYLKAAKTYNVPRTTVFRLANQTELSMPELLSKKIGSKPLFDKAFEDMLVNYALIMEDKLYGLTQMDMRRIAYQLAIRNNLSNPFKDEKAGRYWLKGFLSRHRQILSMRKPSGTSFARASGFTKERMNEFYDNLDKIYDEKKFTADRIFNVDETVLSIFQSKYPKIIARRGKKQIGAITSAKGVRSLQ
ncbi:unnamed protein product, partial [Acanthoscelides obtectus]